MTPITILPSGALITPAPGILVAKFFGVACTWSHISNGLGMYSFSDGTELLVNSALTPVRVVVRGTTTDLAGRQACVVTPPPPPAAPDRASRTQFGPWRHAQPASLRARASTGDDTILQPTNGLLRPVGDPKPYAHGGAGIEPCMGWDSDVAYHVEYMIRHMDRMPIWAVHPTTGRPSELAGRVYYNLDQRKLPGQTEEPVAHDGAHQVRLLRHILPALYHGRCPLAALFAWMLAEENAWGTWSPIHYGPLDPSYPGEWINPSLYHKLHRTPPGMGILGPLREAGWVALAWATWIDALRRGWVELPTRWLVLGSLGAQRSRWAGWGAMLLDYIEHAAMPATGMLEAMPLESWGIAEPGKVGGQSFEWGIGVVGFDALARSLDRGLPRALFQGSDNLYRIGKRYQYTSETWGPSHYFVTREATIRDVGLAGQPIYGDPAHVLAALAVMHERGAAWAIDTGLKHWVPHTTRDARKAWLQGCEGESAGWGARMQAVMG